MDQFNTAREFEPLTRYRAVWRGQGNVRGEDLSVGPWVMLIQDAAALRDYKLANGYYAWLEEETWVKQVRKIEYAPPSNQADLSRQYWGIHG